MARIYRVARSGEAFFAVERDGELRRATGDPFRSLSPGAAVPGDLQKKESQYTRCKGFDTFAPIGPCIATALNGEARTVEGLVNGQRRQSSSTRHLIFSIEHLIEFITFVMTLEPGDIISTGTPEGIGPLAAGDTVTVRVGDVGELTNPVMAEG